jgi:5'(3')-deoxyribonucleotidase
MKSLKVLSEGDIIDYQTVIEETIGSWISQLKCYDPNWERKSKINGKDIERDRAYFVADADYELIIRKKRESK